MIKMTGPKLLLHGIRRLHLALAIIAVALPLYSQEVSEQQVRSEQTDETIFSGPQPGEKLPPLKGRIVVGDNEGQQVDLVSRARGRPLLLIFMNDFGETVNELMRVITLYVEQKNEPELVTAVVWVTSDPNELEAKVKSASARGNMPKNTPVAISLEGPEGPGAYGLNRHADMTLLIANDGVVTSNFALIRPSINADSLAVIPELVALIGGKRPTLAEILAPRHQQIVATRIERMVDESASDERVQQLAKLVESFVSNRLELEPKLGEISSEIVQSGRFDHHTKAIGYLRKWAAAYKDKD
jgi:hypothetical protein